MEITKIVIIQGRNEWGPPPVLEAQVKILNSTALPGGEGWIPPGIAELLANARFDGGLEPSDPRTAGARVVGQLAMTFQRLAGSNGTFVAARMAEESVVTLALDFQNERLARAALEAAMDLYTASREDRPFPFAKVLAELREIANDSESKPSTSAAMFPSAPKVPSTANAFGFSALAG